MPIFQVDIEKNYISEFWTNRYLLQAANIVDARSAGQLIVDAERTFHKSWITFTKYRTRTVVEGDDAFITTPLNIQGSWDVAGDAWPLFNVVRVDFTTQGLGRPSRKFYRCGLSDGNVNNGGVLAPDTVNLFLLSLSDLIEVLNSSTTLWVDPDNQIINSAVIYPQVGMRQLRRGSKRRATPIL